MKLFHLAITLLVFIATSNSQSNIAADTMKENSIVRIMSYNIRHGSPIHHDIKEIHLDSIAAAINAQKPDLVALQEVDVNTGRSGQDLDEAKELGKLTGMNYFFSRSIDFDGGAYGVAVLSRVPIQEYQRFPLPMPDTTGEARSVAMVTVEVLPGIKINFASTHLDLKVDNRMAQVNELTALSRKSKYPLIIAGDFNAFPNSGEIKNLREEFSFACLSGCPLTFPSDKPAITIDYSILNPAAGQIFKVVRYEAVNDLQASDHLPLLQYLKRK